MENLLGIKQLLKLYQVKAQEKLSQNFILNPSIRAKIASFLGDDISSNLIIEIGCGPGNLTRSILEKSPAMLYGIEKDQRFHPILHDLAAYSGCKFKIFMRNALLDDPYLDIQKDWLEKAQGNQTTCFSPKVQLIGNLPFNVATPMHLKWLRMVSRSGCDWLWNVDEHAIEFILMFQKEVARRIVAEPGTDSYGRLAVISQSYCNVSYLGTVQSRWFVPKPEVDAGIVKFIVKPRSSFPQSFSIEHLEALTNIVMHHPNKLVSNNLKIRFPQEYPSFYPKIRPSHLACIPRDLPIAAIHEIGDILIQENLLFPKP